MPRVKLFDQEEALQKAMELFWEKGYASTSLNDLTDHLGIGKGSFYATFESKQALFTAAFELYKSSSLEQLMVLLRSESDVKVGLRRLFTYNMEEMLKDEQGKGCFVSNTCAEYSGFNVVLQDKLIEHYKVVEKALVDYLVRGKIGEDVAESVATTTTTFLIGMSQRTKFDRNKDGYLKTIDSIIGLLD